MAGLVDFELGDIGQVLVRAREAITGKRIEDPAEMAKISLGLSKLEHLANSGQLEINKIEAASDNVFVAGWRPFIGWVCGVSIAYAFVIQPIFEWAVLIFGITLDVPDGAGGYIEVLATSPTLDTETLYQLVLAMLGMATLRTYEKKNNVAREK